MCYVPSQQNVLKNALIKIVMPVCPSAWQHVVTYVLTVFSLSVISKILIKKFVNGLQFHLKSADTNEHVTRRPAHVSAVVEL